MAVYSWSAQLNDLNVEYYVDIKDPGARPCLCGTIGLVDESKKLIIIHQNQGLLKLIPIDLKGKKKVSEPFNVRLTTLDVISMCLVEKVAGTFDLAVLHRDHREFASIKMFQISVKMAELKETSNLKVEDSAEFMIPVSLDQGGGIIVAARNIVSWHSSRTISQMVGSPQLKCFGLVSDTKFLLGDLDGQLHVLIVGNSSKNIPFLKCSPLGSISIPTSLVYLVDGFLYVGSHMGDSQLLKLPNSSALHSRDLKIIETFPNLAPLIDFCLVDLKKEGQGQIVACSGASKNGSLRVIRNGIGIESLGETNCPGIRQIWTSSRSKKFPIDTYIFTSFKHQTRIQLLSGGSISEVSMSNFILDEATLCVQAIDDKFICQVTMSGIRVFDNAGNLLEASWFPAPEHYVTHAAIHKTLITLSTNGGKLLIFDLKGDSLVKLRLALLI